jgi:hypothetical protein
MASLAVMLFVLFGAGGDVACIACNNRIVEERLSPNGAQKVVVFVRDCGATTWFTTEVSILPTPDKVSARLRGNILRVEDDQSSREPVSRNGAIEVRIDWKSDSLLNLLTPKEAVIGHKTATYGDVRIEYGTF